MENHPQQTNLRLREAASSKPSGPMPAAAVPLSETFEVERLRLGHVDADFLSRETFLAICRSWLRSGQFHHVVTLNPEMVMQAEADLAFRQAVQTAELKIPDGAGLIWAQWYIRSDFWSLWPSLLAVAFRRLQRIPGTEAVLDVAQLCQETRQSIYLLGGTAAQVSGTAEKLKAKFPDLLIYTSAVHDFAYDGPASILADVQAKKPAVLLAAYGAPKQSIWIEKHRDELSSVKIAIGVGGAFAMLSEERPRAPRFLQKLNLEWLWRLLLEPSRLPRIWRAVVQFPLLVSDQKKHKRIGV